MSLRNDDQKLLVIKLDKDGYKQREISEAVGIPQNTISDFLLKKTYTVWWYEFEDMKQDYNFKDVKLIYKGREVVSMSSDSITVDRQEVIKIETTVGEVADDATHFVIPDTQVKPNISLDYLHWVGMYIANRQPDVIVHLGDHADMESLSSYDKGKRSAEGKRVQEDIKAAIEGMNVLLKPIHDLQQQQLKDLGEITYKPRMVLTLGNHEFRIMRHVDANPELHGFLSYEDLRYEENGWEVFDFLNPVIVNGVTYVHFMANPMTGKPYGGAALNVLKNVGESFTQGHKQTLDVATRFLPSSGKQQWAIVAGACYVHEEAYKGYQGNHHWRGVIIKHNVSDGSYNPMFVDLDYLEKRYGRV
jgi:hypothetical protein